MKRFKTRKRYNYIIMYFAIFLISTSLTLYYLYKNNLIKKNTIVDILINDNFIGFNNKISDASFIIKYALNVEPNTSKEVIKLEEKEDNIEIISNDPIVYLYNTHQEEKYKNSIINGYDINSGVLIASKILKEYLKDYGIISIVEEDSIKDKLNSLNWKYGYSYKVSRMFLDSAYKKNPTLKYFIDIHRDSSKYEKTTINIDGTNYARLLFVIGLENNNYELNLSKAVKLKEMLNNNYHNICRGIMKKSGPRVNGVYNQDFNENTLLIEVGGQYNTIDEVNNSLKVLAKVLSEFIKEDTYD